MLDLARKDKIRLWRIVPSFLRKPFKTQVAQIEPRSEVTSAPLSGKVEGRSAGKALGRSSARLKQRCWSYGGARDKRRGETEGQEGPVVKRRELQRGSSFPGGGSSWQSFSSFLPGRLGTGGGISKEEARKRLLGWRRTTSVRKVS